MARSRKSDRLVWVKLPNGKLAQVRENQTPQYQARSEQLRAALTQPLDPFTLRCVLPALRSR